MRNDYRVLWWISCTTDWRSGDGRWSGSAQQKYLAGGYEGIFYQFRAPVSHADLTFLNELPGLRYVEIDGKAADDTAVFGLAELEEAVLIVRCRRPLPKIAANGMSRLVLFGDRPGLERISKLSKLRDLTVWGWKGQDLSFLAGCKSLTKLKIEANRHLFSLMGLEGCRKLEELELLDARVDSLLPLRELRTLRRLRLIGDYRMDCNAVLDLSDIGDLDQLEDLTITFAGEGALKSLEPLTRLPRLRDVRLRGSFVVCGDLSPLRRLRPGTTAYGPND